MATVPLVPTQIQTVLQAATMTALGIEFNDAGYAAVRVDWQTEGQPAQDVDEDIVYVGAIEIDDPYNRGRDNSAVQDSNDSALLAQTTTYTRCWEATWTVYGPNSFDRTRQLRSALFGDQLHDALSSSNLFMVMDVEGSKRVPEQVNGLWRERVDFKAQFYENVVEKQTQTTASSVEIIIDDYTTPPHLADFFVPPQATPIIPPVPTADITAAGGAVTQNGEVLNAVSEIVTININSLVSGLLGLLSIDTTPLASGDYLSGGTFLDGGSIIIDTPGYPTTYAGSINGAMWTRVTLGDGTHYYVMSGTFTSPQGSGTLVLTTSNIGTGNWASTAPIASVSIHYN